ncbi:Hypothetical_protein [Hexamita inflata]|uniref:Hypothetical_protein n=1 Tax=Hexamita inflata TaxID=28002 RepID=A0AA86QWF5_9EUKA|nr:Hypothetical protein HINF_LOCUS48623 [Hexamita inflata]
MPQITIRPDRPTLSNSNSTVTEMIDFNYVTQLHKQAQNGALTKHEELNTAGTNQRRPSEVFKLNQNLYGVVYSIAQYYWLVIKISYYIKIQILTRYDFTV